MRFLDTNIVVYAILKPKPDRVLTPEVVEIKNRSKLVLADIDAGTVEVATTVVHLNEMSNYLSGHSVGGLAVAHETVGRLMANPRVTILDVNRDMYGRALARAQTSGTDIADALAMLVMDEVLGTREIYTFNRKHLGGFTALPW